MGKKEKPRKLRVDKKIQKNNQEKQNQSDCHQ